MYFPAANYPSTGPFSKKYYEGVEFIWGVNLGTKINRENTRERVLWWCWLV